MSRTSRWGPASVKDRSVPSSPVRPPGGATSRSSRQIATTTRMGGERVAGRFYLDTSAYLAILLGEAGSAALVRELAGGHLLASSLLALETYRNLVRLSREAILSAP